MVKYPNYVNPDSRDYTTYASALKQFNRIFQDDMRDLISSIAPRQAPITILTTGSDGRQEKGPVSKMEFIVLREGLPHDDAKRAITEIIDKALGFARVEYEIKDLQTDEMAYAHNDHSLAYPMRILDSVLLYGDQHIFTRAKRKLLEEFDCVNGSHILERVKRKSKEYKETTQTGYQKYNRQVTIRHFDPEQGICVYDPQSRALSFKPGPLRYIQFELLRSMITSYRGCGGQNKQDICDMFLSLPTNTVDKILALECLGFTGPNPQAISSLCDAYNYFLHKYNSSQENYEKNGIRALSFDPAIAVPKLEAVCGALESPLIRIVKTD